MHMPGDNLAKAVHNTYKRLVHLVRRAAQGIQQRPVRSSFYTFFDSVTLHIAISPVHFQLIKKGRLLETAPESTGDFLQSNYVYVTSTRTISLIFIVMID